MRQGISSQLFGLGTTDDIDEAMQTYTYYLDAARAVLDGSERVDTLNGMDEFSSVLAKHTFYQQNPQAREVLTAITELGKSMSLLELEGHDVAGTLAELVIAPLVNGVSVSIVDVLNMAGIDTLEQQKTVVTFLSDYVSNPFNSIEKRGQALRQLLPNLLQGGIDDPNLFKSMLSMVAHSKEGAKKVIESMSDREGLEAANQIRTAYFEFRDRFQNTFQKDLIKAMESPAFMRPLKSGEAPTDPISMVFRRFPASQVGEAIFDFVDQNLFAETGVELELRSLDEFDLTDRQREQVAFAFTELFKANADTLKLMNAAEENWYTARERKLLSRNAEERETAQTLTIEVKEDTK